MMIWMGFQNPRIYDRVSKENRILIGVDTKSTSKENRSRRKLQNIVIEPSVPVLEPNVIEDSSIDETQQEQGLQQQQQNNNNKKLRFPDYAEELIKNQATKSSIPTANEMKTGEEGDEEDEILDKDVEVEVEEPKIMFNQPSKPVLRFAEKIELSLNKLKIVANPILNDHPKLQNELIRQIAYKTIDEARIIADQMIHDIQTGGLKRDGNSYYYDESVREKLEMEIRPTQYYLNLLRQMHKMLFTLTGHKLNRDEYRYVEENVMYSNDHRCAIINELNELAIVTLDRDLRIVKMAVDNMLKYTEEKIKNQSSAGMENLTDEQQSN